MLLRLTGGHENVLPSILTNSILYDYQKNLYMCGTYTYEVPIGKSFASSARFLS